MTNGPVQAEQPPAMVRASELNQAIAAIERLKRDLQTLATAIYDEAMERDWCSEYELFADDVNSRMSEPWLQKRRVSDTVSFIVNLDIEHPPGMLEDVIESLTDQMRRLNRFLAMLECCELEQLEVELR